MEKKSKTSNSFGGFKSGFFNSAKSSSQVSKKPAEAAANSPSIKAAVRPPHRVAAGKSAEDAGVEETTLGVDGAGAMTNTVNDTRLSDGRTLGALLQDPAWVAVLDQFQRDPQRAMETYRHDADVRGVMTQLCARLGDNFLNMSPAPKSEKEQLSARLSGEPRVREALESPLVQSMMRHMKRGENDIVHGLMTSASSEERAHIQLLIDFGLFSHAS